VIDETHRARALSLVSISPRLSSLPAAPEYPDSGWRSVSEVSLLLGNAYYS